MLVGPRQVGKTTLIMQLRDCLLEKRKTTPNKVYYFNLDVVADQNLFTSQTDFIQFIRNRIPEKDRLLVFVDEAQRIKNVGVFFKGVYDLKLPVKLILTGSSSLEIKSKITEPLTGRKKVFTLFPLSFAEYVGSRDSSLISLVDKDDRYVSEQLKVYLEEFLIWGGYPKVLLEQNLEKRNDYLNEIFTSYIEKDVISFFRVRDGVLFSQLVKILAQEIGNLLQIEGLSKELGMKNTTIKEHISILEGSFLIHRLRPFFHSQRTEIRKMPKIYFLDTGIRNHALNSRDMQDKPLGEYDKGSLLENFVLTELLKRGISGLHFWRTKNDAEVDFVLEKESLPVPVEVKAGKIKKGQLSRSFLSFLARYQPKSAIIVNMSITGIKQYGDTRVYYVLPYQLIGTINRL